MVLLDTNIASLLHPKKSAASHRFLYEPHLLGQVLVVSFQTVAELFQWAEERRWGPTARQDLDRLIGKFVVVPYDTGLARTWGRVMAMAKSAGRRLESADAWIVATAVHRRLPLITHDRDLVGLPIPDLKVVCFA